jgi:pimeloyl-ACP methyl ester carboxylesterase
VEDLVVQVLEELTAQRIRRGELSRGNGRMLRWVESVPAAAAAGLGTPGPAVVFSASFGETGCLGWLAVLPLLDPEIRWIAYDRSGLGASDPDPSATLQTHVDDLAAVAEQADGPCILAGASWGGLIAQAGALRRTEIAAGLVLSDPSDERMILSQSPAERQMLPEYCDDLDARAAAETLEDHLRSELGGDVARITSDPGLQARVMNAHLASYAVPSWTETMRAEDRTMFTDAPSIASTRRERRFPSVPLVIFSASTGLPPERRRVFTGYHRELAASVPGSRHIVVPGAGHAVQQERPALVADAITRMYQDQRTASATQP